MRIEIYRGVPIYYAAAECDRSCEEPYCPYAHREVWYPGEFGTNPCGTLEEARAVIDKRTP